MGVDSCGYENRRADETVVVEAEPQVAVRVRPRQGAVTILASSAGNGRGRRAAIPVLRSEPMPKEYGRVSSLGLASTREDGESLGIRRNSQHVLVDELIQSGIFRRGRTQGLGSYIGVVLSAAQNDVRTEQCPERGSSSVWHPDTPRIDEPTATSEPVKRHVRVAEHDRRLSGVDEGVSVALDRRVDEHDLGIAAGGGVAEPHRPLPGDVYGDRQWQIGEQVPMSRLQP